MAGNHIEKKRNENKFVKVKSKIFKSHGYHETSKNHK